MKYLWVFMLFLIFSCPKREAYSPVANIDLPIFEQSQENLSVSPNDQIGSPLAHSTSGLLMYREASSFQRLVQDRTVESLKTNTCYLSRVFENDWLLKTSAYEFRVDVCLEKVPELKRVSFYAVLSDAKDRVLVHQGSIAIQPKEGVRIFVLKNTTVCDKGSIYRNRDIEHFAVIETLEGKQEKTNSIYVSNVNNDSCF